MYDSYRIEFTTSVTYVIHWVRFTFCCVALALAPAPVPAQLNEKEIQCEMSIEEMSKCHLNFKLSLNRLCLCLCLFQFHIRQFRDLGSDSDVMKFKIGSPVGYALSAANR